MCGIIGYIGNKEAYPVLIKGLRRLEYRGYDSAGIALSAADLNVYKCKGKVADLESEVLNKDLSGNTGIGHTRWATHGDPNDINSHPHLSCSGDLALVHNGIIENYASLKEEMIKRGHKFLSDTDTEVLVHLIEDIKKADGVDLVEAVRLALNQVVGAYAIVILSRDNPNQLIAAKKSSPLVIGLGDNEFYLASDATPIIEYTKRVIYLEDEEIVVLTNDGGIKIKNIKNEIKTPYVHKLELDLEVLEKGGFDHFMLKEIYEQPKSIRDSMRGRLRLNESKIILGGLRDYEEKLTNAKRIIIVGCGTSLYAGLLGEYLFEDLARISVEVEFASEFRYRNPVIGSDDIVIAISQSGETADTLAAVELAKNKGALVLGICNVISSSIARATDAGVYTHAGPEIGVASTKAFTAQVTILTLMALSIGYKKGLISNEKFNQLINELDTIPEKVNQVLESNEIIKGIAQKFINSKDVLYVGRGFAYPVALEGALKLKEISYIHAEGFAAGEMKHGPIALIDENMPVIVLASNRTSYDKVTSNIQEIKSRKGIIIAIVSEGDEDIKKIANYVLEIPKVSDIFSSLLAVIPLQLLAYHIAVMRGCNVDQPRNLAKSVTVE
ncbi:MAG: Isomerizing Glutamine-fructose-6-phosphate aminotransferase [Candidatus Nomurabacteria bacterium GW2011_GWB1_37_5]|uniref:Glutamine--fructose-6-phosphate aminotransferase [isomerizing] n=1 Tax=Candidatus Nomurabacteria bacterium GW2011_GWB1_37_5 TaxID=1618742 RepID=A0A0G0JEK1_9BACT|nr:MAG: Isomerizing Glutamine-fructose-6-phosphate aminotransferase [Candidatus Nomurabacteria bacterium GW2011_GWB1_37_5]